jgi:hypothetical protein
MKLRLAALALVAPIAAHAGSFVYTPTPSPTLNNLDHHCAYTWRIDNINLGGATITGATLTFNHIANWDNNANMLFIHLLDTAKYSGVRSFIDASGAPVPDNQIADNFAAPRVSSNPLVASGTANTFLTSHSFTMTPVTFTYTFTAAQLAALQTYITHGKNIAFGFDPDCHYFNNGVTFAFTVPETGNTLILLSLFALIIGFCRWKGLVPQPRAFQPARIKR